MLPSSPHVREVYTSANGILKGLTVKDSLLIDSSTIDPQTSRDVAALATEQGATMIDAPVSGGVGGAEAGTLTFMVGGSDAAFERSKPILQKMGKNIVHCGDVGTGQVRKGVQQRRPWYVDGCRCRGYEFGCKIGYGPSQVGRHL